MEDQSPLHLLSKDKVRGSDGLSADIVGVDHGSPHDAFQVSSKKIPGENGNPNSYIENIS